MSSLLTDIPAWVQAASAGDTNFRRAVHVLLYAIATTPILSRSLCMKGGILMALHYRSERYTSDVDFSTPDPFTEEAENIFREELGRALALAPESLEYNLACRIQSFRVDPGRDKTFVTLRLKIGYAEPGTSSYKRLEAGQSSQTVGLDYSFRESIPELEVVELTQDGELQVYGLSTLVAEKLRALLQQPIRDRGRRQDIYDLHFLIEAQPVLQLAVTKTQILRDLMLKCAERDILAKADSFDAPEIRRRAAEEYDTLAEELPEGGLPPFETSFTAVADLYRNLPWSENS